VFDGDRSDQNWGNLSDRKERGLGGALGVNNDGVEDVSDQLELFWTELNFLVLGYYPHAVKDSWFVDRSD
jgi:hypothetical protein